MKKHVIHAGNKFITQWDHKVISIWNKRYRLLDGKRPRVGAEVLLFERGDVIPHKLRPLLGILPFELELGHVPHTLCVPNHLTQEEYDYWEPLVPPAKTLPVGGLVKVTGPQGIWKPVGKRGGELVAGKAVYVRKGIEPDVIPVIVIFECGDIFVLVDDCAVEEAEGTVHPIFTQLRTYSIVEKLTGYAKKNSADHAIVALVPYGRGYKIYDLGLDFVWGRRTSDIRPFQNGMIRIEEVRFISDYDNKDDLFKRASELIGRGLIDIIATDATFAWQINGD